MQNQIIPCLWFSANSNEVAEYYTGVFNDCFIESSNPVVTMLQIMGSRMMFLNGGDNFKVNPAISYFIYCGSSDEAERLFEVLSDGGKVMIPLGKYDWAEMYAWVEDKFGVSWQIDADDINVKEKVIPALLFTGLKVNMVSRASEFYSEVFEPSMHLFKMPAAPELGMNPGAIIFSQVKLLHSVINLMAGPGQHNFDFTPGNSFCVICDTQAEIDYYWDKLGADGRYDMCGWLADQFGVSWQIVPAGLGDWISHPEKGKDSIEAMLKMKKLIISELKND
ncbi:MAG: VOC family protein [Bacteroidia bacterium]